MEVMINILYLLRELILMTNYPNTIFICLFGNLVFYILFFMMVVENVHY